MSNPYLDKARATNRAKLGHSGVSRDSEDSYSRAKRIAKGYAEGGEVEASPMPASPFSEVKEVRKPRIPKGPTVPPPVKP